MAEEEGPKRIKGVGILRYPVEWKLDNPRADEILRDLISSIREGTILLLSSRRDEHGYYQWDFKIEGGAFDQVEVRRSDEERPRAIQP